MKNTTYISPNEISIYDNVTGDKKGVRNTALLGLRTRVHQYYNIYCNTFIVLHSQSRSSIRKSESVEREALLHCYDSPTSSFKPYRGLIKQAQIDLFKITCPYCLVNESDTLDHYIPKAKFPEYSILIKNLIPCCTQCNKLKDERWRNKAQRRIIHFHNDTFLNSRFLFAKITVNRATKLPLIKFFLKKPAAMSMYDFAIIKYHFKDLNLLGRYTDKVNTYISTPVKEIENFVRLGAATVPDLQASLKESYSSWAASYSENYFGAVVYEAFASNSRYLNSFF